MSFFSHELAQNGVRGLMLDMYDFNNDIWLCHSYGGKCYNYTAFVSSHEPVDVSLNNFHTFGTFTCMPGVVHTFGIKDILVLGSFVEKWI